MNIYVGNIAPDVTEEELRRLFDSFGQVGSLSIARDRETGQRLSYGYVVMTESDEGIAAIEALNGRQMKGQALEVREFRPEKEKSPKSGAGVHGARVGSASD
ncbi:MAG: RNA recognition motif domain-containing protein [Candidatus Latescibacterota bacterium]